MSALQVNSQLLAAIERYARCELPLEDLCRLVREKRGSDFIHNENYRWVNLNQVCPERKVRITRQYVETALGKRRSRMISERDLVDWATMIIINDVFYWKPEDADFVAEWVNRLSLDLIPEA